METLPEASKGIRPTSKKGVGGMKAEQRLTELILDEWKMHMKKHPSGSQIVLRMEQMIPVLRESINVAFLRLKKR